MSDKTTAERMRGGYTNPPAKAQKRLENRARSYREDPTFERLRQLPPAEREALLDRSGQRLAYGFYISSREAAKELEQ